MGNITIVGDCIIDAVKEENDSYTSFPGGAGLNLAVGVSRLGASSSLISQVGADRNGFFLRRYLREKGVRLVETPTADFTGVAFSHRVNGEPHYDFNASLRRRRIAMTTEAAEVIDNSDIVAINSFPYDDLKQTGSVADTLKRHARLVVIDPNPRAALISDVTRFRSGLSQILGVANLLKLSDEDVRQVFGDGANPTRFFSGSIGAVLLTHGADGATVLTKDGFRLGMPASHGHGPVVDTMGAGDATLAAVLAFMQVRHRLPTDEEWPVCLKQAMDIAAATCRSKGAELCLPESTQGHAA